MVLVRVLTIGMVICGLGAIGLAQEDTTPTPKVEAAPTTPDVEGAKKTTTTSPTYGFSGKQMIELGPKEESDEEEPKPEEGNGWDDTLTPSEVRSLSPMVVTDCDGDGRNDLFFVSRAQNKVHIFYRNETYDNFTRISYDLDEEFSRYEYSDINGDGIGDLLLIVPEKKKNKKPKRVVSIRFGKEDRKFAEPIKTDMEAKNLFALELTDGAAALALIAPEDNTILLTRWDPKAKKLTDPERYANPDHKSFLVAREINGDGRTDLVLLGGKSDELTVRLQLPDGSLGPQIKASLDNTFTLGMEDIDHDGRAELFGLHANTKALKLFQFLTPEEVAQQHEKEEPEPFRFSNMRATAFDRAASGEEKSLAIGDLNGDGRNDIAVTDGAHGRLLVFLQSPTVGWEEMAGFSTFAGAKGIWIADLIGDENNEVVVLSRNNKMIGISSTGGDKLVSFPAPITTPFSPTAFACGDFDGDGRTELIYGSTDEDNDDGEIGHITVLKAGEDGTLVPYQQMVLDSKEGSSIKEIRPADLNGDGKLDFIAFFDYEPHPGFFVQKDDGSFENLTQRAGFPKGFVKKLRSKDLSLGDMTGDGAVELVIREKNYAKLLKITPDGMLVQPDQYNGKKPDSVIDKILVADLDHDGTNELLMLDSEVEGISVLTHVKGEGLKATATVDINDASPEKIYVADLNNDGINDLLVLSRNRFGVLYGGAYRSKLEPTYSYRTRIKGGRYTDVATGDLNGDGKPDIAAIDGVKHHIEILSVDPKEKELVQELTFLTFRGEVEGAEDELYRHYPFEREEPHGLLQPKNIAIVEMTGDDKKDVVIRLHNYVIIYVQE